MQVTAAPPREPDVSAALARAGDVHRSVLVLEPLPQGGVRGLGPLAIVADRRGVAERLAARLDRTGMDVVVVATPEELDRTRGVVFLGGLDHPRDATEARDVLGTAFLAAKGADLDAAWMTVTALGGDLGVRGTAERAEAMLAGLAGLTKTVALEHPGAWVRALDLVDAADPDVLAAQIEQELGRGGPVEVGLGPEGRATLVSEPTPYGPERMPAGFGPDDVVLVSGGARGVTAACVRMLARASRCRFVLLGRSAIDRTESPDVVAAADEPALKRALFASDPTLTPAEVGRRAAAVLAAREARATLASIEAAGGTARYLPVDVTDPERLGRALDEVRTDWGPFTALIHGAGVLQDKRIRDKTLAQFDVVVDTKLMGLITLLERTTDDPLRALVLFSSVAARGGNVGQADYALANEALNRIAASEATRRPGCVVRSIGWGPWAGGMVTPALARHFEAQGVPLLDVEAGAAAFVAELACDGPAECVVGGEIAPPRERSRAWRPSARTLPWLRDHALAGVPVVPVAMAMDRMLALARAFRGDTRGLVDVRVLKGIPLHDFEDAGEMLELGAEETDGTVTVTLRGSAGRVHYRARVRRDPYEGVRRAPEETALATSPWPTRDVYARELFHGPAFQVLTDVRMGPAGMRAKVRSASGLNASLPPDAVLDVPAVDGAIQLAALWTRGQLGAASLPTGVLELRVHAPARSPCTTAVLTPVRSTRTSTVSDVWLLGADGEAIVELLGLELHALPSGEYPDRPARTAGDA